MAWNFGLWKKRDCTIYVAKTNDQLRGYWAADLHLCFCICKKQDFSWCRSNLLFTFIVLTRFLMNLYLFIEPAVPEVIVEGHNRSHSTVVTVSWELPRQWSSQHWQNLSSFTVFWCRGSRISASCTVNNRWFENNKKNKVSRKSPRNFAYFFVYQCRLLITLANMLDPDLACWIAGHYQGPNCLTFW